MGFISFIKEAGAKVFGIGKTTAEENAESVLEESARVVAQNERAGLRLIKVIGDLGLKVEKLGVDIAGEIATIHGTADKMVVSIEESVSIFHTVVRGDTLSKIANRLYGNAAKYTIIFEANRPMLSHPDRIYPGQVLRVPALKK